jgi:hypothetical protein
MKSALAAGAVASILLGLSWSAASAQTKPVVQPRAEAPENAYELPLPPARPTAPARRIRVSQAVIAPLPEPARPAPRKLSTLWLTVGYGF